MFHNVTDAPGIISASIDTQHAILRYAHKSYRSRKQHFFVRGYGRGVFFRKAWPFLPERNPGGICSCLSDQTCGFPTSIPGRQFFPTSLITLL